jgi:prolycopene isomerase
MHSLTIWTIAPYLLEGLDWSVEREKVTDALIKKAESVIPDLSRHIVVKDSVTPEMFEGFTLGTEGATVGWVQTPQEVFARPQQKTPIENLYLAGHWTMPGGGYMLTAKSGINAAKMILGE